MAQKLTYQEFNENYRFIKDLGSGTYGQVMQYEKIKGQKQLAVKKLQCNEFDQLSSSIQEMIFLSRAQHKNIDLTSALLYMQEIKLSHRDIKPHNILKIDKIHKLTDFGVSKSKSYQTVNNNNNTLTGSPPYLAPQLFENYQRNKRTVKNDPYKSDAFSLGLVILGCALLQDISGCNQSEQIKDQMLGQIQECKRYGKWLQQILKKLLEFEEENRWDFVQLQEFIDEMVKNYEEYGFIQINNYSSVNSSPFSTQANNLNKNIDDLSQTLVQTLQIKVLTQDEIQERNKQNEEKSYIQKLIPPETQKNNNDKMDQEVKFVMIDDEEDMKDTQFKCLTPAQTFEMKKDIFLKQQNHHINYPEGIYVGQIDQNKQRQGQGQFLTHDKSFFYNGEWKEDYIEGYGQAIWKDGKKYSGQWKKSQRCGKGKQIYCNGDTFEGDFEMDVKHGQGVYITHLCEKYEGQYKFGEKHGFGLFEYNDGTKYEGYWKVDQKNGDGILAKLNGEKIYEGQFKKNKYHGKGKLFNGNCIYEGEFVNNLKNGEFTVTQIDTQNSNDKIEIQMYENGKQISRNGLKLQ